MYVLVPEGAHIFSEKQSGEPSGTLLKCVAVLLVESHFFCLSRTALAARTHHSIPGGIITVETKELPSISSVEFFYYIYITCIFFNSHNWF